MILTSDRVDAHPDGAPLEIPRGTHVTSLARQAAEARGIEIVESGASSAAAGGHGGCGCGSTGACRCDVPAAPPARTAPRPTAGSTPVSGDWTARLRRGKVDASVFGAGAGGGATGATGATPPVSPAAAVLGPAETHVDACTMGAGGECREDVVVVTAVGRNRPHVLAELATGIADVGGDIQEISQRIVEGWFHTILTVDISRATGAFPQAKEALEALSREDDYTVRVQHERVFRYMHRI